MLNAIGFFFFFFSMYNFLYDNLSEYYVINYLLLTFYV